MPKRSQAAIVLPQGVLNDSLKPSYALEPNVAELNAAAPFDWETVQRTVLKFATPLFSQESTSQPPLCQQSIAVPNVPEAALTAMQRLVAVISTLRSSQLSLDELFHHPHSETQALEALIPYVSEEAYDILDILQGEESNQREVRQGIEEKSERQGYSFHPASHILHSLLPDASSLITIETLTPYLLWRVAQSDYSLMHLLEGIRATCWQPEQGWSSGMLRLVATLQVEAPTVRWCFDLATGLSAEKLLDAGAIVQSDEQALPLRQSAQAVADGLGTASCRVDYQLQAILEVLQTRAFGLSGFLQGVPVDLLQPGADWQAGELRLQLGFEFSAQVPAFTSSSKGSYEAPALIDAELMEEVGESLQSNHSEPMAEALERAIAGSVAKPQVSVLNPWGRSLNPATLVRLTETATLDRYAQVTTQQQLAQSFLALKRQQSGSDEQAELALIVQTAIAACTRKPTACDLDFLVDLGLLEPMLLMDELAPKLLWSITSSTYEIMQLLGGLSAHRLQPKANWQQGTLHLLAVLQIQAADVDYAFDLSTGRSVLVSTTQTDTDAIVQFTACPQPISTATLTALLQQQLCELVPAYTLLKDGVPITWLEEVEQDWQAGTIQLHLNLTFIADAN